jgi:hypothetical protein
MNKYWLTTLALPFTALIVTGCGGGSSDGGNNIGGGGGGGGATGSVIEGTAATGAPYTGSDTVHIICKGTDKIPMVVDTDAQGNYSLPQDIFSSGGAQFPCVISLQGGGLHSYTNQEGRVNLTPFTTLAYKRALMSFSGQSVPGMLDVDTADTAAFQTSLNTAIDDLETALSSASGNSSVPFNMLTATFKADHNSLYDRWLDGFGDAVKDDSPLPSPGFFDAFSAFSLKYTTQSDPADFDETANGTSFSFTVPVPADTALYFKTILGEGNQTLDIGITRVGSLSPINETVQNVALPASEAEMCNKLRTASIEIITNGQKLSSQTTNCAWMNTPPHGWDIGAVINHAPAGQAVFRWKAN